MSQTLSEYAEQLIACRSTVIEFPNEHVSSVVSELICYIADTPALAQLLKAQFDPMAHHSLPELIGRGTDVARNKILYDAYAQWKLAATHCTISHRPSAGNATHWNVYLAGS